MSRKILLTAVLALVAQVLPAAVDLTPLVEEYVGQGMLYHRIIFKQTHGSITMELPNQWSCTGTSDRVRLTPPAAKAFAEGLVTSTPLAAPQPLNETVQTAFKQQILRSLPAGNQSATVIAEIENSISFCDTLGFEFVVSYKLMGQTFRRNAILVHLPDTRLVFQFSAPEKEFEALSKSFRHAIFSGQWVQPPAAEAGTVTAAR
jgi:hypothetical protein